MNQPGELAAVNEVVQLQWSEANCQVTVLSVSGGNSTVRDRVSNPVNKHEGGIGFAVFHQLGGIPDRHKTVQVSLGDFTNWTQWSHGGKQSGVADQELLVVNNQEGLRARCL